MISNNDSKEINPHKEKISNEGIYLSEICSEIWKGRYTIAAVFILCVSGSLIYSLTLPNLYKATSLLTLAERTVGGNRFPNEFGGLASIVGISGQQNNKMMIAIETLKSRGFLLEFIKKNNLEHKIVAVKGWKREDNTLLYDNSIYDQLSGKWAVIDGVTAEPNESQIYETFRSFIKLEHDAANNFVRLSVEYYSPLIAAKWNSMLIDSINNKMREQDINEAERSIKYLEQKLGETPVAELKKVFYQLIEDQMKAKMLARVRGEYIFAVIDAAYPPEQKSRPQKVLIILLGATAGLVLGIFVVLSFFAKKLFASKEVTN